jgi:polysaccharide export outer membrane protein
MNVKSTLFLIVIVGALFSCSKRNLVYFSNIEGDKPYSVKVNDDTEPRIKIDDLLSITVTSLNPESNMLFNAGVLMPSNAAGNAIVSTPINESYLVNKLGNINYPVIGEIYLEGLTKMEAVQKMNGLLNDYVQNPIVNIRFMNFKVTVMGEVQNPDTFIIPTEKISILEALGMAGDMTAFGKRENVLLIREKDGYRTATRINLNDKEILGSPNFYLHQNDILYVEPVKTKAIQSDTNPRTFAIISSLTSLAIVVLVNLRWLNN